MKVMNIDVPGQQPASAYRSTTRGSRRWWFPLAALVLSGLLGLGITEASLRLLGLRYGDLYVPDPQCGSRLRAGYQGWFTQEGRAFIRINSAGHRDHERVVDKPDHTLRVAVLGDSFAEALQVPIEQTFWAILERQLTNCPPPGDRRVEVLNFGVSGYGTAQALQMLRHTVWPYQPDIVLLAFYPGNDVKNNSRELEEDHVRPFFRFRDGQLQLDDSFQSHPTYVAAERYYGIGQPASWRSRLVRGSRLLQLIREVIRRRGTASLVQTGVLAEPGMDDLPYREPKTPAWEEAWMITDHLVRKMAEEVQARGAEFHVVVVTRGAQVHPDPNVTRELERRLGVSDLSYVERRMESLAADGAFGVIPLAEPLSEYARAHQTHLHGFPNAVLGGGHWNETGHRVVGDILTRYFCSQWRGNATADPETSMREEATLEQRVNERGGPRGPQGDQETR